MHVTFHAIHFTWSRIAMRFKYKKSKSRCYEYEVKLVDTS